MLRARGSNKSINMKDMEENYFSKLISIFFRPRKFFDKYEAESDITKSFIFLLITAFIASGISTYSEWFSSKSLESSLIIFLEGLGNVMFFGFVFSAIFYVGVKLAKGKSPYYQTFKAFAYITAFAIPLTLITELSEFLPVLAFLGVPMVLWVLFLLGYGLNKFVKLSGAMLGIIYMVSLIVYVALYILITSIIPVTSSVPAAYF